MVIMPHWPIPLWKKNINYDLSRINTLLFYLGNPHLKLPPVVHVAGTNGKGSTVAYLHAIFQKAGYKVHTYTSPHLLRFNERILISSEEISDDYLFQVCEKVRLVAEIHNIEPTFFEATTAAAFIAFSENNADILFLETGMGGREDATNVISNPLLTIITPISFDHMEYLGPNLKFIAGEKAGIIKSSVPCIISSQIDEVFDVLFGFCDAKNSRSIAFSYDFGVNKRKESFVFFSKEYALNLPLPNLLGDHQIINCATVIAAVLFELNKHYNICIENIIFGITNTKWPARIQKIPQKDCKLLTSNKQNANKPFKKEEYVQIWIDGAHNSGGAQVVSHWIRTNLNTPVYIILGMTKNRNAYEFINYFKDITECVFTVNVKSEPLSYSADKLMQLISPTNIPSKSFDSLLSAIQAVPNNKNLIITGSLFLTADFLHLLQQTKMEIEYF